MSMNIQSIIAQCGKTTKEKGFDTSQHATQIALIATEVAEALECVHCPDDPTTTTEVATANFCRTIIAESNRYEAIRKQAQLHIDQSIIADQEHLCEELADICIRVFSYVGGNGMTRQFLAAMEAKMEKNRNRPHKHGKGF